MTTVRLRPLLLALPFLLQAFLPSHAVLCLAGGADPHVRLEPGAAPCCENGDVAGSAGCHGSCTDVPVGLADLVSAGRADPLPPSFTCPPAALTLPLAEPGAPRRFPPSVPPDPGRPPRYLDLRTLRL